MSDKTFRFDTGAVTHTGHARDHNEDNYLAEPEAGLWVVADGMGGHHGGDFASAAIVDHLGSIGFASSAPDLQARFVERITRANGQIQQRSRDQHGATIGATVAALLVYDRHFACVWSGDSRVYLIRDGALRQLTRDHTEVQELLDRGAITPEEARNWPRRNVITRAIGVSPTVDLDHAYGNLRTGDTFVLCSDGLTAHVADDEIAHVAAEADPSAACERLLDLVLERGASDNVTILVVRARETTLVTPLDARFDLPPGGG